jgi:hypothetical protein
VAWFLSFIERLQILNLCSLTMGAGQRVLLKATCVFIAGMSRSLGVLFPMPFILNLDL